MSKITVNIDEKSFNKKVKPYMDENDINYDIRVSWFSKLLNIFSPKEKSFNEKINDRYVAKHPHDNRIKMIPIHILCTLKESTFEKYPNSFSWEDISRLNLSAKFIENNLRRLDLNILSKTKLPPNIIINYYQMFNIKQLFDSNDMIEVYEYLYDKEKLSSEERSFLSYLGVWDIIEDYRSQLEKRERNDIVDRFFRTTAQMVEEYEEETKE